MMSHKHDYVQQHKQRSFFEARERGRFRRLLKQWIVLAKFKLKIDKIWRKLQRSIREYNLEVRMLLIVLRIKFRLRNLVRRRCRHSKCQTRKSNAPLEDVCLRQINHDRLVNALTFLGQVGCSQREHASKLILKKFLEDAKEKR